MKRVAPERSRAVACLLALAAALSLGDQAPAQKRPGLEPVTGAKVGDRAHDVTLKDLDDRVWSLKEARGHDVVHLVFWATWCVPCLSEIPELRKAYDKYHDRGFTIYAVVVNMDQKPDIVRAVAREMKVNYPVLWDEKDAVRAKYRVEAIPQNFLIDRDGIIRFAGNELPGDYESRIEKLLGSDGGAAAQP